jgi:hypothetical protein
MSKSPVVWFIVCLLLIAVFTATGPAEKTLGVNARIVYLHGAWVWAALAAFIASAAVGLIGLILRRDALHRWSRALGRTGLFFWITYLPISMWAMQTNWNGLFLAEPRWRFAVVFAIGGLILQAGVALIDEPKWASVANSLYLAALFLSLSATENVMHPPSPMLNSDAPRIQFAFFGLFIILLLAMWQVARWWHQFEASKTVAHSR